MNPPACNNISIYFINGILGEVTMNLNNKFQALTEAFIYELYYSWYEQLYIKNIYFFLSSITLFEHGSISSIVWVNVQL